MKFKGYLETSKVFIRMDSRICSNRSAILAFSSRELFTVAAFSEIYRAGVASTYEDVINAIYRSVV